MPRSGVKPLCLPNNLKPVQSLDISDFEHKTELPRLVALAAIGRLLLVLSRLARFSISSAPENLRCTDGPALAGYSRKTSTCGPGTRTYECAVGMY